MELRLVELAFRLLDPRRWRQRLAQLGGLLAAVTWIWFRAVNRAEVVRAVADVRHDERDLRIRTENAQLEFDRLRA